MGGLAARAPSPARQGYLMTARTLAGALVDAVGATREG